MSVVIAALYQFTPLEDCQRLQHLLLNQCCESGLKGTLLLAEEGINGTVAGSREAIDGLRERLSLLGFNQLEYKESFADFVPFYRMKVKVKEEIVTLGLPSIDPNRQKGTYIEPEQWNELISDPEVIVIDTRNDYEFDIGTFQNAVNPNTENFRAFPEYVKRELLTDNEVSEKALIDKKPKKIAMFCTGGIRCEKSTSFLRQSGIEEVYHLKGGILNYLEKIPAEQSLWHGECFVFDNRVAVNHDLAVGQYELCHGCRYPITEAEKQSEHYREGVCCARCVESLSAEQKANFSERQKQIVLARERGQQHLGTDQKQQKRK